MKNRKIYHAYFHSYSMIYSLIRSSPLFSKLTIFSLKKECYEIFLLYHDTKNI